MSAVKAIALSITPLLPLVVSARGAGGHHAMGIVKAVDEKGLTLHTAGGKDETFALDDTTRFEKSGVQSSAKNLKVGDKAVVHARKMKNPHRSQYGAAGHTCERAPLLAQADVQGTVTWWGAPPAHRPDAAALDLRGFGNARFVAHPMPVEDRIHAERHVMARHLLFGSVRPRARSPA